MRSQARCRAKGRRRQGRRAGGKRAAKYVLVKYLLATDPFGAPLRPFAVQLREVLGGDERTSRAKGLQASQALFDLHVQGDSRQLCVVKHAPCMRTLSLLSSI